MGSDSAFLHLIEFIGPLVGRASDGDSRRRELMLRAALSNIGAIYQPIPRNLGFIFTCLVDEETRTPQDFMDQDYIHNHNKLVNHLHHGTRVRLMGDYMVHSNHFLLVLDYFSFDRHGLIRDDVDRRDR